VLTHRARLRILPPAVLLLAILPSPAPAGPTVGFIEHWSGTATDGWTSSDFFNNPGTGGVLGAGDGFLLFTTPGPTAIKNLGVMSSGAEYTGNWLAAGITQVRFWVNDVGNPNPLEIHLALGDGQLGNFWQYNPGFIPAQDTWTPFVVDLTSAAAFTHIINENAGTFDQALQNVNRILIRHDRAPYTQSPDTISADVGIDELLLTDGVAGVAPGGPRIAAPLQMAPPYPNPSRGAVALSLETFEVAPVTIEIVDVSGRIVRHAALPTGTGVRLWTWDGATDAGTRAPAGIYRVRAFGPSGGASRSLVRLPSPR
jgi:hypothetical protein